MTPTTGTESPKKKAPTKKAPTKKAPTKKAPSKKAPDKVPETKPSKKAAKADKLGATGKKGPADKTSKVTAKSRLVRPESNDWLGAEGRGWWPRPDSTRPHVRLGVLWFLVVVASLGAGPVGLAVVYGTTAAVGAAQTARAWSHRGRTPHLGVAAAGGVALPLGACFGSRGLGAAILVAVAATVLVAPGSKHLLSDAGATVRCWLFIGLAAATPVLLAGIDLEAAIALVLMVSAYECGDYLVGTDARWPAIGPIAGVSAVAVVSSWLFVVAFPPFGGSEVVPFAVALAVLAPLGQIAASYVLPDGRAVASGLRRLDSLLLAGPAWVVLFWTYPFSN